MEIIDILNKLKINSYNIDLYKTAFTHTSYANEHGNVYHITTIMDKSCY